MTKGFRMYEPPNTAKANAKGALVQFRVDDFTMSKLKNLADGDGTSPGMLCRRWAMEKITEYESRNLHRALAWHNSRVAVLRNELADAHLYEKQPFFILHVVPLSDNCTLDLDKAFNMAQTFHTLSGRNMVPTIGRFNHLGFEVSTAIDPHFKVHLQLFRTGEVEAIRPLWVESEEGYQGVGLLAGGPIDQEIVHAASSCCNALAGLRVPFPFAIFVTICGAQNKTMSFGYSPIQSNCFDLPITEVRSWAQLSAATSPKEPMANTMRSALDVLWNAAGLPGSASYERGNWLPERMF
jgi:hypothetical protein